MKTQRKAAKVKGAATPKFPSNEKIVFLMADDFRQELGSKLTILGYVPSNVVYVAPEVVSEAKKEGKRVATAVTLIFSILDGSGTFKGRIGIAKPDGKELWGGSPGVVTIVPGIAHTMILKLAGLDFVEGEYRARLQLDEQKYERTFRFVIGTPPRSS